MLITYCMRTTDAIIIMFMAYSAWNISSQGTLRWNVGYDQNSGKRTNGHKLILHEKWCPTEMDIVYSLHIFCNLKPMKSCILEMKYFCFNNG